MVIFPALKMETLILSVTLVTITQNARCQCRKIVTSFVDKRIRRREKTSWKTQRKRDRRS